MPIRKITICKAITFVMSLYLLYLINKVPIPPSLMINPSTNVIINHEMAKFWRRGNKFSLAAFHDEFLKDGCMPLEVAEKKMDRWAEEQK